MSGFRIFRNLADRVDTTFTIQFFTTEIIPSRLKPSVNSVLYVDEGDTINFRIECEEGSFPVENISFFSNLPIKNYKSVKKCDDEFIWSPPYDFIKETDSVNQKLVLPYFIGTNKFFNRDTAVVKLYVKSAMNYPFMLQEYELTVKEVQTYTLQLKYAFVQLDKKVKNTKTTRTTFDMTTGSICSGWYRIFICGFRRCANGRKNSTRCRRRPCPGKRNRGTPENCGTKCARP